MKCRFIWRAHLFNFRLLWRRPDERRAQTNKRRDPRRAPQPLCWVLQIIQNATLIVFPLADVWPAAAAAAAT